MNRAIFALSLCLFPAPLSAQSTPAKFAPLPVAVSSFGAAVSDYYLYIYGGHAGKAHDYSTETVVKTFHRLKVSNPTKWEDLPGGPGLQGLALVAHQGMIYRIGGMQPRNKPGEADDTISLASCERFNPEANKWEKFADLPEPRSSHDAVVLGNKIFVVGGWKMNGKDTKPDWSTTMFVIDLSQKIPKWESLKQSFGSRRALTGAGLDGKIYVMGGLTPSGELSRSVDIYDPVKETWTKGPEFPGPDMNGFSPAAATLENELYLSVASGRIYQLNKKRDAWNSVATLEQPRFVHRLLPIGDHLLVAVGGASKKGNVAATEVIVIGKMHIEGDGTPKK